MNDGEKGLHDDVPAKRVFSEDGRSRPFDVEELHRGEAERAAYAAMARERLAKVSGKLRRWGGLYAPPAVAGGEWERLYDGRWPGVLRVKPGGVTPHQATEKLMEVGYPIAVGDEERLRTWLEEERT